MTRKHGTFFKTECDKLVSTFESCWCISDRKKPDVEDAPYDLEQETTPVAHQEEPQMATVLKNPNNDWRTTPRAMALAKMIQDLQEDLRTCFTLEEKCETLACLGICHYKLLYHKKAESFFKQHLKLAKKLEDPREHKMALCNLGCVYKRTNRKLQALDAFEDGLEIVEKIDDPWGKCKLLQNLGSICEAVGEFDEAVSYYKQRLGLAVELKDLNGECKACTSLGNVHHIIGDLRNSIEYYDRAVLCLRKKQALEDMRRKCLGLPPTEEMSDTNMELEEKEFSSEARGSTSRSQSLSNEDLLTD